MAEEDELKQKMKTQNKVVTNATQMREIYTPHKDFMTNKFGKKLLDGIIRKAVEEKLYPERTLKDKIHKYRTHMPSKNSKKDITALPQVGRHNSNDIGVDDIIP